MQLTSNITFALGCETEGGGRALCVTRGWSVLCRAEMWAGRTRVIRDQSFAILEILVKIVRKDVTPKKEFDVLKADV